MQAEHFDVLVVGGGTAGCVLAARLSEDDRVNVGLVEAGPDYGPYAGGGWPAELLDARAAPASHDWDPGSPLPRARGRVIGGSSARNGCWALAGSPADYDAWAPYSDGLWDSSVMLPRLRAAAHRLRARPLPPADRTAWHEAVVEAAGEAGLPYLDDVNADDAVEGVGWVPVNITAGDVRWQAAFAYLDPVRDRRNLRVLADSLAVRLEFDGSRVRSVVVLSGGRTRRVGADRVVLCCGSYGNPPLLMRSGVGPRDALARIGVPAHHVLPGVGQGLTDHSGLGLTLSPLPLLDAVMPDGTDFHGTQTVVKARSGLAPRDAWDLHIVPAAEPAGPGERGELRVGLYAYVMAPRSRGAVYAASADPGEPPVVDHGFFTDPDGTDLRVLLDGIDLAHRLAGTKPLSRLTGLTPWEARQRTRSAVRSTAGGYWHPVGTCAMGPDTDPAAVADGHGRVHGLDNLHIGDASLIPVIPRANTHLTVVALADRLGELLTASHGRAEPA